MQLQLLNGEFPIHGSNNDIATELLSPGYPQPEDPPSLCRRLSCCRRRRDKIPSHWGGSASNSFQIDTLLNSNPVQELGNHIAQVRCAAGSALDLT